MRVKRSAPAKINLTLEVGAKREDGYHDLKSVMARIDLCDVVEVEENTLSEIRFFTNTEAIPATNLCTKAVQAYLEKKGLSRGVDIFLECNIPLASGMGGGSADAAATLECMEALYGRLDGDTRHAIARSLGADVPFCLEKTPCFCEGIGDECTPLECSGMENLWLVVIKRGEKLSTGKVYSDFDALLRDTTTKNHAPVIRALESGDIPLLADSLFNDFERVVFDASPELTLHRDFLLEKGALRVVMSGAGPTLIGLFDSREKALSCNENIYRIINKRL